MSTVKSDHWFVYTKTHSFWYSQSIKLTKKQIYIYIYVYAICIPSIKCQNGLIAENCFLSKVNIFDFDAFRHLYFVLAFQIK